MSIKLKIDQLSLSTRQKITTDLNLKVAPKKIWGQPVRYKTIKPYVVRGGFVYIPYHYGISQIDDIKRPPRTQYTGIDVKFVQPLRDYQNEVKNEIIETINTNGSCILSFYPGFGKTSLSIYLASKIKLKTLVVVHRLVLIDQWVDSICKFCPGATYKVIGSKSQDFEADFLIVNAINVEKIGSVPFQDVGFLIVDEIHTIATETLSKSLFYITPRYLMGLSATPTRADGMDILLDIYFGEKKITKTLYRSHTVYAVTTKFQPELKYSENGRVNWGGVIEFQSNMVERNNMIVNITQKLMSRNILILCKRISQAQYLIQKLQDLGDNVTSLIGSSTQYDKSARIMVATIQKCGVGFDFSKLNTLILAADVQEYFIQYLGRVMRTPEGIKPIIFDIVDDNAILKRHFSQRKKVYISSGGEIIKIDKSDLNELCL